MLVAMLALVARAAAPLPPAVRVLGAIALMAFLGRYELRFARDAGFARVGADERRYVAVARFVEASMPANSVFLTLQHGGSIRHYANRLTVRFDLVPVGLDEALASLERGGWRPYILLEDWEETQFKAQFAGASKAGQLDWRPLARLPEPGGVNIYDPRAGSNGEGAREMKTIPMPAACDCRHY
jgi:hypothetical protein